MAGRREYTSLILSLLDRWALSESDNSTNWQSSFIRVPLIFEVWPVDRHKY